MQKNRHTELIENAFPIMVMDVLKGKVNTACVARVEAWDGKNKITVQPVVNRKYRDKPSQPQQPIEDVTVLFPGAGGSWFTFPIETGSFVLLVCSQRSIDAWKNSANGDIGDASTVRKFSMSDAVAIPGIVPWSKGIEVGTGTKLQNDKGFIEIGDDGQININDNFTVDV